MTQAELIAAIAQDTDVPKAQAEKVLKALKAITVKALNGGEKVLIPGIGQLQKVQRAARKGRNPQTGKELTIPAKNVAKFTASKSFSEDLN